MDYKKIISIVAGPLSFILLKSITFNNLSYEGQAVLASTVWIAIWWITEAIEVEVTSLLPVILFPLSGAMKINEITACYGHPYIFLFLGGFVLGLAIEKWYLHERIAFSIIRLIGESPKKIILGFMAATAFLSMWISNTATAIMMLPIALSVTESNSRFSKNLMLAIAYSASIGGMATLIGTPPNIIFAGIVKNSLGTDISFVKWMELILPLTVILLIICWLYLVSSFSADLKGAKIKIKKPDAMTNPQKRVAFVFVITATLWITRTFLINKFIPFIDDTIIAICAAVALFLIPSGKGDKTFLMDWQTAKKLPWGILLIFGAGLSIAKGFSGTDLTTWLIGHFSSLKFIPSFLMILIIVAAINFLTEITSNTATASIILPILITLAASFNLNPLFLLTGAVLAASCAFMLPVATPPNAIVFGSGSLKIKEMVKAGFWMNIFSIGIICILVWFVLPHFM